MLGTLGMFSIPDSRSRCRRAVCPDQMALAEFWLDAGGPLLSTRLCSSMSQTGNKAGGFACRAADSAERRAGYRVSKKSGVRSTLSKSQWCVQKCLSTAHRSRGRGLAGMTRGDAGGPSEPPSAFFYMRGVSIHPASTRPPAARGQSTGEQ